MANIKCPFGCEKGGKPVLVEEGRECPECRAFIPRGSAEVMSRRQIKRAPLTGKRGTIHGRPLKHGGDF